MGLQVIWTKYGQDIFEEKLTTIANDLRIFTFNVFHNHLINRLYFEYSEEIQGAKGYYKKWQTELDVKAGLLIFLEDLVTHVFYNSDHTDTKIERQGILGISKARTLYSSYSSDQIYLAANKKLGVLKNQLNLGMTGRYKGPMMNMGFFDRSFTYRPHAWEHVNRFMSKWVDAIELQENIVKLITNYLFESTNKEYPELSLQELKSNRLWKPISEGYIKCFGSQKLPTDIKDYWKDRLGLSSGAPEALYKEISILNSNEYINHQQVFSNAKKHLVNEPSELSKIEFILALEPFLSHSEYLLRYIAQPNIKTLSDEETSIGLLRKEIIASAVFSIAHAHPRLVSLHTVMLAQLPTADWLRGILHYHFNVMDQRGGTTWIELTEKNNFKHYFAPTLSGDINTVQKYLAQKPWWHTYYMETLRSIYQGLK